MKLTIPKDIIQFPQLWEGRSLAFCAMNRGCFIVIPAGGVHRMAFEGFFKEVVAGDKIKSTKDDFEAPIPDGFINFYMLHQPESQVDVAGQQESLNQVYVTVNDQNIRRRKK